ncbi:MAG: flagellar biosynthesis regulator FlaF [Alphaproteobacteria bacterium]
MNGYQAYHTQATKSGNPREIEYRLLGQVTGALLKAKDALTGDQEHGSDKLAATRTKVEAVIWNRDVWSAFKVDLMSPENQLPQEIKGNLVSLALFVEKETTSILSGETDLDTLIDINKSIMEGLAANPATAAG